MISCHKVSTWRFVFLYKGSLVKPLKKPEHWHHMYLNVSTEKKNPARMAEKWPRFGGPWPSWGLAWTMNWVDRLRTSADKRMWSGRRAVVMRIGRRAELLGVKLGCPRSRCRAVVSDVLCVRSYVNFVCVCVYMCMRVCVRKWYTYIYACVYVFVHLCVYTRV